MEIKWLGYCIECCKWRHAKHIIKNVRTSEMRCRICITRLLITCPVCKGGGKLKHKIDGLESCLHCGGQRVVPQMGVESWE